MFDTMTLTKALGGFCGAFLIFLLGKFAAETIYHTGGGHGGDHGEVVQGYLIEVDGGEAPEPEAEVPFEERFAMADAGRGERVFNKCKACHKIEAGENGTGPYLYGVVGREKGAAQGFGYTAALGDLDGTWTPENIYDFLNNPGDYAPGTAMSYALKDSEDRVNVIAYLDSLDD